MSYISISGMRNKRKMAKKNPNIIWEFNEKRFLKLAEEHKFWGFGDEPDYVDPNYDYARKLILGELDDIIESVDGDRTDAYYIITIDERGWFAIYRTAKEFFEHNRPWGGDCLYREDGVTKYKTQEGTVSLWEYDKDVGYEVEISEPRPNCLSDVIKMGKTHKWESMDTGLSAVRNFWHKYIPKSDVLRCLKPFYAKGDH